MHANPTKKVSIVEISNRISYIFVVNTIYPFATLDIKSISIKFSENTKTLFHKVVRDYDQIQGYRHNPRSRFSGILEGTSF